MSREDTQFKRGQSGNPKGRPPKGNSWADVIKEAVGEEIEYKGEKKQFKTLIAEVLRTKALKGDLKAIDMIMERMDGKAVAKLETKLQINADEREKLEKEFADLYSTST